jgi:hypothetical protein
VFPDFGECLLEIDLGASEMPTPLIAALARLHDQVVSVHHHPNRHQLDLTGQAATRPLLQLRFAPPVRRSIRHATPSGAVDYP